MVSLAELERLRRDAASVQSDIAKASAVVAAKRKRAADARASASSSRIQSTIASRLREAEGADRDAAAAEKKRSDLERRLADKQKTLATAESKYMKEQHAEQKRSFDALRRKTEAAARQFREPVRQGPTVFQVAVQAPEVDVFLSHASEDKDDFARPLKEALEERGVSVWFDEINIQLGQSIRQEIEKGISHARFGVVVLSPDFFTKQWTRAELDALFSRKMASGENLILPIWHRVTKDEVVAQSPLLAGLLAANTAVSTIGEIADMIAEVVSRARPS